MAEASWYVGRPRPRRVPAGAFRRLWETVWYGTRDENPDGPIGDGDAAPRWPIGRQPQPGPGRVVVAHDQEIASLRIHGHPGVTKMAVNDTGLILLVVVDPKLHGGLAACHGLHDTAHLSSWKPGLATRSEKHDRNSAKVEGVASGNTTEKWSGFEKVATTSKSGRPESTAASQPKLDTSAYLTNRSAQGYEIAARGAEDRDPEESVLLQQSPLARSKLASLRLLRPPRTTGSWSSGGGPSRTIATGGSRSGIKPRYRDVERPFRRFAFAYAGSCRGPG